MRSILITGGVIMLAACTHELPVAQRMARADPAATVSARGQTDPVGTAADDAADDPAIWRNAGDPSASLIVGTDKKAGLYVYDLSGRTRSFLNAGRVNNVDLREDVMVAGTRRILVVASDRNNPLNAKLALLTLDPATGQLQFVGHVQGGAGEAYGLCLYRAPDALYAFLVIKDGTIRQVRFDLNGASPTGTVVRTLKLATQSEGCAVDERSGRLYVGEERRGVWRFAAQPGASTRGMLLAPTDGKRLVPDVEGIAVAPQGQRGGYLVISSQGDNAYAVWSLETETYVGRFRIATSAAIGGTEETDGIELMLGSFGPSFPGGLFVAQDGANAPAAQNFKLVDWADVLKALPNHGE